MDRKRMFCLLVSALMLMGSMSFVAADEIDDIKEPISKGVFLLQTIASLVALLVFTFAGIAWITSGNNPQSREGAKAILTACMIGLVVIWVAPPVVNYFTAPGMGGI